MRVKKKNRVVYDKLGRRVAEINEEQTKIHVQIMNSAHPGTMTLRL